MPTDEQPQSSANGLKLNSAIRLIELFHSPITAWVVLGLSLAITVVAYIITSSAVKERAKDRFEYQTIRTENAIKERLYLYEQVLWGGVGLFNASTEVTRADYANYVKALQLETKWPGVQGIGYSIPIEASQLEAHIEAMRAQGFPEYTVKPTEPREEYSAIIYLEPFDWRNQRAFGYDMWSNPMRREAMARARDNAKAATSGIITLVQETDNNVQRGFLTYVPVYSTRVIPPTVEERRTAFLGWVYAPFRAGNLMQGILGSDDDQIHLDIYDGKTKQPESLLYSSESAPLERNIPDLTKEVSITLQGREWTLYFRAVPNYYELVDNGHQPVFIAVGGVAVNLLLFYVIYALYFLNKRAESVTKDWRMIIEQAPNALIITNETGEIVVTNAQADTLFGYAPNELLGQKIEVLVPHSIRTAHPELRESFVAAPKARSMGAGRDLTAQRKDGSEVPVEIGLSPLNTPQGRLVVASIVDISERKQAQHTLEKIIEQAPNALIMTDDKGTITLTNTQADHLFGYRRGELTGQKIDILVPEANRAGHPAHRDAFFKAPKSRLMGAGRDLAGRAKDGSEVPVEIGLNPLTTPLGNFVVASIVDIKERLRAQKMLEHTNRQLQQKNHEMEQFIYTVSHDLKSPLVTIGGFAKMLSTGLANTATDKQKHQLQRIQANVDHMETLLSDLLQLSRLIRQGVDKTEVDLEALLGSLINTLEGPIEAVNAKVEICKPLAIIQGNERLISQCVQNLLSNAIQYKDEQRPLTITISTSEQAESVSLIIKDTAMGIDAKYHEQIFRIFERLDIGEGTGVGLAIVKTVMEKHSGQVVLESELGKGSTFTLVFPKQKNKD
ncbi:CHASE domain-containing protein [Saccharophagus degradans]|uniref:CHASE domain-containing protein n=1 Tax=Saccharophagus degradans TaxID=86304 RepID=UPI0024782084|nr:CHASE domain-containing protein [Saccharophagus degradans]WGO99336.1 CHASE domain-containing protein [Saccharophagus degradans]